MRFNIKKKIQFMLSTNDNRSLRFQILAHFDGRVDLFATQTQAA